MIIASRYHDISFGHRVVGHEGKCRFLHGHNYRIYFDCKANGLDSIGRVIDFGVIKSTLCVWLEQQWDHRFLMWEQDPMLQNLKNLSLIYGEDNQEGEDLRNSLVPVPFNPTAENLGQFLLNTVGPSLLKNTGVVLCSVTIDETRKCSATVTL